MHDVASSAKSTQRHAAADDLAERDQIGGDAEQPLGTGRADAEAGHHLVKYEYAAMARTQVAASVEKFAFRHNQIHIAGNRLNNDAGDLVTLARERGFQHGCVVVIKYQRMCRCFRRHSR